MAWIDLPSSLKIYDQGTYCECPLTQDSMHYCHLQGGRPYLTSPVCLSFAARLTSPHLSCLFVICREVDRTSPLLFVCHLQRGRLYLTSLVCLSFAARLTSPHLSCLFVICREVDRTSPLLFVCRLQGG